MLQLKCLLHLPMSILLIGACTLLIGAALEPSYLESRVDESKLPQLPAPNQLPKVNLPNFRYPHPRLPVPTRTDISLLQSGRREYLRSRERLATEKTDLYSIIMLSRIYPGSQNLALLFDKLIEVKFSWRGHNQVKPLAVAYDWLFDQWSEAQRKRLQEKLIEGCNYIIEYIRKERLSPYNVYLYNSPFQALVACSLALYGDDSRAEHIMRFTHDLWKNRVLPVWRQIMGRNGGWHEGGEYVHIGIGQAIYQVPAMWRHATGEDLFSTEPRLRGFLDFLIYRVRPDNTIFRLGDAAWFTPWLVPDRIPLALEYGHIEAFSLLPPPKHPEPTSWPWGPIVTPALYNPTVISSLPLARYFDGIGLLVSRTNWSPNATYVTFKAGDNYWSHVHLDQGSFTIYKGGALAIDSGLYGPKYGSDHHMNYTYQTIAHNTITVTDPKDIVPAPRNKEPRLIANDGGQRRIGSGWGVEAAPLDLKEWQQKKEIYHTGLMKKVVMEEGIVVGVSDLTPAYTNRLSGKGTFSHRTRRVERFWRTFGHDQMDDVIVIFDQVRSTNRSFRKRWLFHTIEEPKLTPSGFLVSISPTDQVGHDGGQLEGHMLLPKNPKIEIIGGTNFAFFVAGRSYDENGEVFRALEKRKRELEPGAWRIEATPPDLNYDDKFLVVLLPTIGSQQANHQVRLLEDSGRVGCEVIGPHRTTRWWFNDNHNSPKIEILKQGAVIRLDGGLK